MADKPSFMNLDQAQSDLNNIKSKMQAEMSNFENQTVQQTRNTINSIGNEIKNLYNTISSDIVFKSLNDEVKEAVDLFKEFKAAGEQAISAQKYEVEAFTNNISQMYEAIKKSHEAMQQFNTVQVGDINQVRDFERSINNLKNSFENFVTTSDIINLNQNDLDSIRQRMMDFLKSLSTEGSNAFNLAQVMTSASQDPALKTALVNMLVPLNEAIAQIPDNVINSFTKAQNQLPGSGGGTNIVRDLIDSLNSFSGVIQSQIPGTGVGIYDANFANQQKQEQRDANVKTNKEIESETISRVTSHVDKILSASAYSSKLDKDVNKVEQNSIDFDSKLDRLLEAFDGYSKSDKSLLNEIGINKTSLGELQEDSDQIQRLLSHYEMHSDGAGAAVSQYKKASKDYENNSSAANLQKLVESERLVKEEALQAGEALNELMNYTTKYMNKLDVDTSTFKYLPDEMKEVLISMSDLFNNNIASGKDLLKLYEAFGINLDSISENLRNSMRNTEDSLNRMNNTVSTKDDAGFIKSLFGDDSKIPGYISKTMDVVGASLSGYASYYKFLDKMDLNPGLPTSVNDIYGYFRGGTQWYKKFGQLDYQNALAQMAQGTSDVNETLLDKHQDVSKELFAISNGQIKNEDYYNIANKLTTQIQGQYGGDKEIGLKEVSSMARMATMIEKVYGVDSVNTINTFYKEFGMGTKDVSDLLGRLVETAERSNIPVNQYVKTITDLSLKFKNLGVDIKLVESGMRNLTMEGMSFVNAQDMVSNVGNAVSNYTENKGQMAVYGMLSGQFTNPWEAMWTMMDRWDSDGNLKPGATDAIINSLSTQMDYTMKMYGGNEWAAKIGLNDALKDLGISDAKTRNTLVNKYYEGEYESFGELMDKYFSGDIENADTRIEDKLDDKISQATNQIDELTKAENELTLAQQNLAGEMKTLTDILAKDMREDIKNLTGTINNLIGTLSENGFAQGIADNMNWMGPLGVTGINILGMYGGAKLATSAGRKIRNMFGKIKGNSATDDVLDAAYRSVDEVVDVAGDTLSGAFKSTGASTDDIFEIITQSGDVIKGSADEIAEAVLKSGDEVVQLVGEGGQLMFTSADELAAMLSKSGKVASKGVADAGGDLATSILKSSDEIIAGSSKILGAFSKWLPAVGSVMDFGFTYSDAKKKGDSTTEAVVKGTSAAATSLGLSSILGIAGASLGTLIAPGAGTAVGGFIGTAAGSWLGSKIGEKAGDGIYDMIDNSSNKTGDPILKDKASDQNIEKLLQEYKQTSITSDIRYAQTRKSFEDEILAINDLGQISSRTTRSIDLLQEKTDNVSQVINKKFDEQITVLKEDGIKLKSSILYTEPDSNNSGDKYSQLDSYKSPIRDTLKDILSNSSTGGSSSNNSSILNSGSSTPIRDTIRDTVLNPSGNNIFNSSSSNSLSGGLVSKDTIANKSIDQVLHQNLTQKTNLTADDINNWIASKTNSNSKMRGMGEAFIKASQESGLDPLYLVSHAALETGWGTSTILKDKNNWFGIGAFDNSPYESAYGFNNLEAGIIEGAKWIAKNYTFRNSEQQNTLYKMVNAKDGWHNYATDPGWARKIASIMITGAGGKYQAWDGTKPSDVTDKKDSILYTEPDKSISNNIFGSSIFNIRSAEWSNGAQQYSISDYKDLDFGENSSYIFRDSQAMARSVYLDTFNSADLYKSTIEAYDNRSSAYNQNPEFNININVNGEGGNYEAMAREMQEALSNIALQYMGSSARIASANYERVNSQY